MAQIEQLIVRDISPAHYHASATAVWCYDERFRILLEDLYHFYDFQYIDTFRTAGGAKDLAVMVATFEAKYILTQIKRSVEFHQSSHILLMVHDTCSAYGDQIPKDKKEKLEFFAQELSKAEKLVSRFLKDFGYTPEIRKYIADFDGLMIVR